MKGLLFLTGLLIVTSCQGTSIPTVKPSSSATVVSSIQPPSPTPSVTSGSAPIASVTPSVAPTPRPTPTLPEGVIPVVSEYSGRQNYCNPASASPKLKYPLDLAVTQDGATVYVINSDCHPSLPGSECLQTLDSRSDLLKRREIFRLKQNAPAEEILQAGEQSLSCRIPHDLEIDQNGNLYLVNGLDERVERISPAMERKNFLEIRENSGVVSHSFPPTPMSNWPPPSGLQIMNKELFFSLFSSDLDEGEFQLRKVDLQTAKQQDFLLGKSGFNVSRNYLYAAMQGKVYMLSLTDSPTKSFSYPRYDSYLEEYISFQTGLLNPQNGKFNNILLERQTRFQIDPFEMRAGSDGVFYLSDIKNHQIWTITLNADHSKGVLRVLAGSGQKGYKDGKGTEASFYAPTSLSLDGAGNLYVADTGNSAIRKVTPEGVVTTFYKAPD